MSMSNRRRVSCGLELVDLLDLQAAINTSAEAGFDFIRHQTLNIGNEGRITCDGCRSFDVMTRQTQYSNRTPAAGAGVPD